MTTHHHHVTEGTTAPKCPHLTGLHQALMSVWLATVVLVAALALSAGSATRTHAQTAPTPAPAATQSAAAPADEPRSVLVVFDGSGSMWGKLDGERQTKLVQARDAIKKSLSQFPAQTRLGLSSFGHRRQGDCNDIATIAQLEPATADHINDHIIAPLEKLNPKGKGPLANALREAAKTLGKMSGPKSLVVIHDDIDNCQQDACAALGEIQTAAPGILINIIGLGIREEDAQKYQCLTRPTGGRHVNAVNAEQISTGIEDALKLAANGPPRSLTSNRLAAPKDSALAKTTEKPIDLAIEGPPALRLRGLLAPNVPVPDSRALRWTIYNDATPGAAPTVLSGANHLHPQAPGTYRIVTEDGVLRHEATVTVKAKGHTLLEPVFNAGIARLKLPLQEREILTVYMDEPTAVPANAVGIIRQTGTEFALPAGNLMLHRTTGRKTIIQRVAIKAGTATDVDFGGAIGWVQAQIAPPVANDGKDTRASIPATIAIEEDDPDAARGRKQVMQSAAATAEFAVSAGTYTLVASKGALEYRERIVVKGGEILKRILPLSNARLILASRLPTVTENSTLRLPAVWYRIDRLDGPATDSLSVFDANPVVDLPPGRYRVTAKAAGFAVEAAVDVDVAIGESRAVVLQIPLAVARFTPGPTLRADGDLEWRITAPSNQRVWSETAGTEPILLASGRYTVNASGKNINAAITIELKPGESRAFIVGN